MGDIGMRDIAAAPSVLVLGTADWDQAIATNQHYVVREIAREYHATYVESIGLRTPEFGLRDLRRIWRRFIGARPASSFQRALPDRVRVVSPRVLPRHVGLAVPVNRYLLRRRVANWLALPREQRILWTYTPVTYGLELEAATVVYHCVDLLGEVEGISSELISCSERTLSRSSDIAIATSPRVQDHLLAQSFDRVELWPNVADVAVIESSRISEEGRNSGSVVFAGNLSTQKIDFEILHLLLDEGFDLHLAGPISEGGGNAQRQVESLCRRGATYHGLLTLKDLASLYWSADIGIIPYVINSYTEGVSPLKTFEYLAAGLGVVSTPIPSVESLPGGVWIAASAEGFVEAVRQAVGGDTDIREKRIGVARRHSWHERGAQVRAVLSESIGS